MKPLRAASCAVFAVFALYSTIGMIRNLDSGRPDVNGLLNVLLFTGLTWVLVLWSEGKFRKQPKKND
jgi:hypothetical protein